jgi:CheY-like chemotaxis protein
VGLGATFRVKLPIMSVQPQREEVSRAHPRAASRPGEIGVAALQGVHVLAVDDEPDALSMVSEVLEAVGARLTTARSVEEALSKLTPDVPDVLVTDLGMPRMDGFQLIARLRQHEDPKVRAIPAAALTAYARSEDRMKVLRAGFQLHLAKPIDPAELVTTIASLAKRIVVKSP